ncbi:hypothetical protein [Bacteroides heparinolyticus]|uniref:hypothetical protein n=1 Tax=Prevotella heparinolytica TaxID=28113 RepID=UPI0035A12C5A
MFALPQEKLLKEVAQINRKRRFKKPSSGKCYYEDDLVFDRFHCLKIQTGHVKSKKAILVLYGGGLFWHR